jgi:retron-type reverse transcriptase
MTFDVYGLTAEEATPYVNANKSKRTRLFDHTIFKRQLQLFRNRNEGLYFYYFFITYFFNKNPKFCKNGNRLHRIHCLISVLYIKRLRLISCDPRSSRVRICQRPNLRQIPVKED